MWSPQPKVIVKAETEAALSASSQVLLGLQARVVRKLFVVRAGVKRKAG